MRSFAYLLRRETWEHRSLYVAPIVVAGLVLLAVVTTFLQGIGGTVGFGAMVAALSSVTADIRDGLVATALLAVTPVFDAVMLLVVFFYLLDSLYADRRDRSVLFWKSLPITDSATVGAKAVTAVVVVPLLTAAAIAVTQAACLVIASVFTWAGGGSAWDLVLRHAPIPSLWLELAYALPLQMLWYLPFVGWLLLASAWARKAPFLWAVLPVIVVGQLEVLAFGSHQFFGWVGERLSRAFSTAAEHNLHELIHSLEEAGAIDTTIDAPAPELGLSDLVFSTGLWGGIVIGLALIAAAVWLRRFRDET